MKIAIHQPNYLPWLGFFYKMAKSDVFVILDIVQYEKNLFQNRNKIKTPQGAIWLTLPVKRKFPQLIKEVQLNNFSEARERHLKTIELNYKKAKYFNFLFPELKEIFKKNWCYLSKLNIKLIKLLKNKLGIKTELKIASDYNFSGKGTDLLIDICKGFKADIYLVGQGGKVGGKRYLEEDKFKKAGIKLEYSDFLHPQYPQLWEGFLPNLSVIDLLFNCGPNSCNILLGKKHENNSHRR